MFELDYDREPSGASVRTAVSKPRSASVSKRASDSASALVSPSNSYGRPPLLPGMSHEIHSSIVSGFEKFFLSKGNRQVPGVDISNPGIDSSVYFIGSPISVLKPFILEENIPEEGLCITQDCIRTRNTKSIDDASAHPRWGSCFTGLISLRRYEDRETALRDSIEYLLDELRIPLENVAIRISSEDLDLIELLDRVECPVRRIFDDKPAVYYTHKYGMGEIVGRNFNYVLRQEWTDVFNDIGNFIIVEDPEKKRGIELALGTSVIMKELYGLDHVLDTGPIADVFPGTSAESRKFQDCVVSSVTLLNAGVRPGGSNTKGRIVRSYLRGIAKFADVFGIGNAGAVRVVADYEKAVGAGNAASEFVAQYLLAAQK